MNALHQLRTQLSAQGLTRWQALSPREQRGVSVLGILLGVWVFWSVAIAPALHTLRDSDNRRTHISQQQAHMMALQAQAKALQTRTPLARDEALRRLQNRTSSPQIQINVQGERVTVQLKGVPAPTLANWLTQARSQAQALPIEAHLSRSSNAGAVNAMPSNSPTVLWDGNLVLSLPTQHTTP